jgi:hypothetical protein
MLPRLLVVAIVLIGAGAAIAAVAGERSGVTSRPEIELARASHSLRVANSQRGRAVVMARNMSPGQTTRGDVSVRVATPARVTLAADRLDLTPGPNGGRLADALSVRIKGIGGGSGRYRDYYKGPISGLGRRKLGRWRPSQTYRFRVRVRFAGGGSTQDFVQGARTSFRLLWLASR